MKKNLLFIVIAALAGCNTNTKTVDYFGQPEAGSTPEIFGEGVISVKNRLEHGISFTPDQNELAFGIFNKEDFSGVIYYAKKNSGKWSAPQVFEPLKNESVYLPYFSPDGKSLVYTQSRPDTNNGFSDIWMLKKGHESWVKPAKVNNPISTLSRESSACLTLDNAIYFSSNRGGNGLADLYFSRLENGEYLNVERIDSICSVRDEESIFVSPNQEFIIFSRYATNKNGPDLYSSYQNAKSNWTLPIPLDSSINTTHWERRPFVTIDNKFLFFTKLTFNQSGLAESDIYWVSTQKVFKPFVFNPMPEKTIKVGKETKLVVPTNYFKDVDNAKLEISLNHGTFKWARFDRDKMTLTMNPQVVGVFELSFTAVDAYLNKTVDRVKIIVE